MNFPFNLMCSLLYILYVVNQVARSLFLFSSSATKKRNQIVAVLAADANAATTLSEAKYFVAETY